MAKVKGEKKKRSSSGKRRKSKDSDHEKKQDLILFGSLIVVILIIISSYFAYTVFLQDDGDNMTDELVGKTEPGETVRGVSLQVISDADQLFGKQSLHTLDIDGQTEFCLLVVNTGNTNDEYDLRYSGLSADWSIMLEYNRISVSNNGAQVVILTITTTKTEDKYFQITATSVHDSKVTDSVSVGLKVEDLGTRTADYGDSAIVYYVLVDRGTDANFNPNKWAYNQGGVFGDQSTGTFEIGTGVIEGFSEMAAGMKAGETRVWRIPAEKAYGNDPTDGVPDGELVYEMTMISIK